MTTATPTVIPITNATSISNSTTSITTAIATSSAPCGPASSELDCATHRLWQVVPPVIMVLGLLGNGLVLVVFSRLHFSRSSTLVHMFVLALTDSVILCMGPLRYWLLHVFHLDVRDLSPAGCKVGLFVLYTSLDFSSWILVSVTVERVVCVLKPLRVRGMVTVRRTLFRLGAIFLFLALLNGHYFFTNDLVPDSGDVMLGQSVGEINGPTGGSGWTNSWIGDHLTSHFVVDHSGFTSQSAMDNLSQTSDGLTPSQFPAEASWWSGAQSATDSSLRAGKVGNTESNVSRPASSRPLPVYYCTSINDDVFFFEEKIFVFVDLSFDSFIPFLIMAVCNWLIITALRKVNRNRPRTTTRRQLVHSQAARTSSDPLSSPSSDNIQFSSSDVGTARGPSTMELRRCDPQGPHTVPLQRRRGAQAERASATANGSVSSVVSCTREQQTEFVSYEPVRNNFTKGETVSAVSVGQDSAHSHDVRSKTTNHVTGKSRNTAESVSAVSADVVNHSTVEPGDACRAVSAAPEDPQAEQRGTVARPAHLQAVEAPCPTHSEGRRRISTTRGRQPSYPPSLHPSLPPASKRRTSDRRGVNPPTDQHTTTASASTSTSTSSSSSPSSSTTFSTSSSKRQIAEKRGANPFTDHHPTTTSNSNSSTTAITFTSPTTSSKRRIAEKRGPNPSRHHHPSTTSTSFTSSSITSNTARRDASMSTGVTRMLILVTTVFLLTTLPASLYYIVDSFVREEEEGSATNSVLDLVQAVTNLLQYCNYGSNFLLYSARSKRFRLEVRYMLGLTNSRFLRHFQSSVLSGTLQGSRQSGQTNSHVTSVAVNPTPTPTFTSTRVPSTANGHVAAASTGGKEVASTDERPTRDREEKDLSVAKESVSHFKSVAPASDSLYSVSKPESSTRGSSSGLHFSQAGLFSSVQEKGREKSKAADKTAAKPHVLRRAKPSKLLSRVRSHGSLGTQATHAEEEVKTELDGSVLHSTLLSKLRLGGAKKTRLQHASGDKEVERVESGSEGGRKLDDTACSQSLHSHQHLSESRTKRTDGLGRSEEANDKDQDDDATAVNTCDANDQSPPGSVKHQRSIHQASVGHPALRRLGQGVMKMPTKGVRRLRGRGRQSGLTRDKRIARVDRPCANCVAWRNRALTASARSHGGLAAGLPLYERAGRLCARL